MLHRKLLNNPIFKNHKLLQVFLYCLLKASHKEHDQMIGDSVVHLKKGQLVTGRNAIAASTGLTHQNVRTALNRLKSLSILTIKPTTKYSIISITNWDQYQQTNQQVTNSQPTSNQQVTTNKNGNKGNNGNNSLSHITLDWYPSDILIEHIKYQGVGMDIIEKSIPMFAGHHLDKRLENADGEFLKWCIREYGFN